MHCDPCGNETMVRCAECGRYICMECSGIDNTHLCEECDSADGWTDIPTDLWGDNLDFDY
jgi:hypothetical protein